MLEEVLRPVIEGSSHAVFLSGIYPQPWLIVDDVIHELDLGAPAIVESHAVDGIATFVLTDGFAPRELTFQLRFFDKELRQFDASDLVNFCRVLETMIDANKPLVWS